MSEFAPRTPPEPHPEGHTGGPSQPQIRVTPPSGQSGARPPILASEALRRDLAPAKPADRPVRILAALVGTLGLAAALILLRGEGLGLPLAAAFGALAALGLAPMAYVARAASVVTVAGAGLAVVTWQRMERNDDMAPLVLLIGVTSLSMALFFRSWHRASLLARALVALGLALCGGWLAMSGLLSRLLVLEGGPEVWLPAVLAIPMALLLMLSLLAFMDSRSTGACTAWGALLLIWYGLFCIADLARHVPAVVRAHALGRSEVEALLGLVSGPLLVAALAVGLAQLLAMATAADGE